MNKAYMNRIAEVQSKLKEYKREIELILNEEFKSYDNMPESFQKSERGKVIGVEIDALDNAVELFEELNDYLSEAKYLSEAESLEH